jgi:hypothetical protein
MGADLVRRPVIDAQCERAAADIKAKCFPGEWLLKNALAKIASEEEPVAPPSCQRREEPGLGNSQILRLVDYAKVVGPGAFLGETFCKPTEDV